MGGTKRLLEEPEPLNEPVCAECFEDGDLRQFIIDFDGPPGCAYCGQDDAPTAEIDDVGEFVRGGLSQEYGRAVDQLPYITREGGYQGWHADTYELLFGGGELNLTRWSDDLAQDLAAAVGDEIWCDWDWLSLDEDKALSVSWDSFCGIVKHERHFFFDQFDRNDEDRDHHRPLALMAKIAAYCDGHGLVKTLAAGTQFYRARPRNADQQWATVADLGPPPPEYAIQFNRMNAPGVPVMYVSESADLTLAEVRDGRASIGTWTLLRPVPVLDLADLPSFPGVFSALSRTERLSLRFLHSFVREITKPVAGDSSVKLDYIPTQAVTEFFRDYSFEGGQIVGVRYPSATDQEGANVVLFARHPNLTDNPQATGENGPWLALTGVQHTG